MAKEYGIKKAVVRTEEEAKKIESFFDYILVLGEVPQNKNKKIRYTINDIDSIQKFPKGCLVELKVDTGMHRNGISVDELEGALLKIEESNLILEAIFTHHRSADELTSEWFWQNENFKKIKEKVKSLYPDNNFRFHSANSASLFRTENFNEDMARVGICAYGCMELPNPLEVDGFKPVLSLYANKLSSRKLKKGESIGYSSTYTLSEDSIVSNYDVGYGDGFFRICSNNYETPNGTTLLGRISMDNSSFLSDYDELLIFDDASKIAKNAKTISYEVLTSLKEYIKREVIDGADL